MKYQFPKIETIQDVLPHIKGRDEFIVAEREGYIVINYMVAYQDTFHMENEFDLSGAIRRECRGLMFGVDEKIISRPFHKFFNLGEREETFVDRISLDKMIYLQDKLDGSMVRPFYIDGKIRWGTKMGITDGFSDRIEKFVASNHVYNDIATRRLQEGITPIFEWYGPQNRIVVGYEEEGMSLLALRNMVSGEYYDVGYQRIGVPHYSPPSEINRFVEETKDKKGIEGYIMVFDDGHRVKLKTSEYARIHKTKDELRYDFYIAQHILNEELDDVKPFLDEYDRNRIDDYEKMFWQHFEHHLYHIADICRDCEGLDRKVVATEKLKKYDGWTKSIVFKTLDGHDLRQVLLDHFKKNVNGQTAHQKLFDWV